MSISRAKVESALKQHQDPYLHRDYAQLIQSVDIEGEHVKVVLAMPYPHASLANDIQQKLSQAMIKAGAKTVDCQLVLDVPRAKPQQGLEGVPPIKNVIVVASGKGGVGKSTTAVNLALALAQEGATVGILDADIYGPSQHIMFGVERDTPGPAEFNGAKKMSPVISYGVKINSIGFMAAPNQAIALRGPMATKALNQLFYDTVWGELDYLIVDLPPGTGDIQISLCSQVPLTGAVVVCTPQEVAIADARKGIALFELPQLNVPILGLIENMAWFTPEELPENKYYIFGKDGGKNLCEEFDLPFLGQIPLVQSIREGGDLGVPLMLSDDDITKNAFREFAGNAARGIAMRNANMPATEIQEVLV